MAAGIRPPHPRHLRQQLPDGPYPRGAWWWVAGAAKGRAFAVNSPAAAQPCTHKERIQNALPNKFHTHIHTHTKQDDWDTAVQLFQQLKSNQLGVRPNSVTFNILMSACLARDQPQHVRVLFEEMTSANLRCGGLCVDGRLFCVGF